MHTALVEGPTLMELWKWVITEAKLFPFMYSLFLCCFLSFPLPILTQILCADTARKASPDASQTLNPGLPGLQNQEPIQVCLFWIVQCVAFFSATKIDEDTQPIDLNVIIIPK